MVTQAFYEFIQCWVVALLSLLLARYVGGDRVFYYSTISNVRVYITVWFLVFVFKAFSVVVGRVAGISDSNEEAYTMFLIPLLLGAYIAKRLLKKSNS